MGVPDTDGPLDEKRNPLYHGPNPAHGPRRVEDFWMPHATGGGFARGGEPDHRRPQGKKRRGGDPNPTSLNAGPAGPAPDKYALPKVRAAFDEALDAAARGDNDKLEKLQAAIQQLENPDQELVLEFREQRKMPFAQVANEMGGYRSVDSIKQLHQRAVRALAAILHAEENPETKRVTPEELLEAFQVSRAELAGQAARNGWQTTVVSKLRKAIRAGRLAEGRRLPSTRDFAQLLDLSNALVISAYRQLGDEGYLVSRTKAGTWIAERDQWPTTGVRWVAAGHEEPAGAATDPSHKIQGPPADPDNPPPSEVADTYSQREQVRVRRDAATSALEHRTSSSSTPTVGEVGPVSENWEGAPVPARGSFVGRGPLPATGPTAHYAAPGEIRPELVPPEALLKETWSSVGEHPASRVVLAPGTGTRSESSPAHTDADPDRESTPQSAIADSETEWAASNPREAEPSADSSVKAPAAAGSTGVDAPLPDPTALGQPARHRHRGRFAGEPGYAGLGEAVFFHHPEDPARDEGPAVPFPRHADQQPNPTPLQRAEEQVWTAIEEVASQWPTDARAAAAQTALAVVADAVRRGATRASVEAPDADVLRVTVTHEGAADLDPELVRTLETGATSWRAESYDTTSRRVIVEFHLRDDAVSVPERAGGTAGSADDPVVSSQVVQVGPVGDDSATIRALAFVMISPDMPFWNHIGPAVNEAAALAQTLVREVSQGRQVVTATATITQSGQWALEVVEDEAETPRSGYTVYRPSEYRPRSSGVADVLDRAAATLGESTGSSKSEAAPAPARRDADEADPLRVLTWNIAGARRSRSSEAFDYVDDLPSFVQVLSQIGAKVAFLQESEVGPDGSNARELADMHGYQYVYETVMCPSHMDTTKAISLAVLSNLPIEAAVDLLLPPTGLELTLGGRVLEQDEQFDRYAQAVRIAGIWFVNLHPTPLGFFGRSYEEHEDTEGAAHARDIEQLLRSLADDLRSLADGPVVFLGDFNTDDPRSVYQTLISELGLATALDSATKTVPWGSAPDQVMSSAELRTTRGGIVLTETDHYPVVADLSTGQRSPGPAQGAPPSSPETARNDPEPVPETQAVQSTRDDRDAPVEPSPEAAQRMIDSARPETRHRTSSEPPTDEVGPVQAQEFRPGAGSAVAFDPAVVLDLPPRRARGLDGLGFGPPPAVADPFSGVPHGVVAHAADPNHPEDGAFAETDHIPAPAVAAQSGDQVVPLEAPGTDNAAPESQDRDRNTEEETPAAGTNGDALGENLDGLPTPTSTNTPAHADTMIGRTLPELHTAEVVGRGPATPSVDRASTTIPEATEIRLRGIANERVAAHEALAKLLGHTDALVLADTNGEPVWPEGVVGSSTHTEGYAAAAVDEAARVRSIGIDAQQDAALPRDRLDRIARPEERDQLHQLAQGDDTVHWDTVLLSAKRSINQACLPLTGRRLGFANMHVTINAHARTFHARLLTPAATESGPPLTELTGRFAVDGTILTAVVIPHPPEAEAYPANGPETAAAQLNSPSRVSQPGRADQDESTEPSAEPRDAQDSGTTHSELSPPPRVERDLGSVAAVSGQVRGRSADAVTVTVLQRRNGKPVEVVLVLGEVGGSADGAAAVARDAAMEHLERAVRRRRFDPEKAVAGAIDEAQRAVVALADRHPGAEVEPELALALVEGDRITTGAVGDSQVLFVPAEPDAPARPLTPMRSAVAEYTEHEPAVGGTASVPDTGGAPSRGGRRRIGSPGLTGDGVRKTLRRNVDRADIVRSHRISERGTVVAGTNGLTDTIRDSLAAIVRRHPGDLAGAARESVDQALTNEQADSITLALAQYPAAPARPEPEALPPERPPIGSNTAFGPKHGLRDQDGQPVEELSDPERAERLAGETRSAAGVSKTGVSHDRNEDAMVVAEFTRRGKPVVVAAVFDGVSGAPDGHRAAQEAAAELGAYLEENWPRARFGRSLDREALLQKALHHLQLKLQALGRRPEYADHADQPQSTVAVVIAEPDRFTVGWVGDSRVGWASADGRHAMWWTDDHSSIRMFAKESGLTEREALERNPWLADFRHAIEYALGREGRIPAGPNEQIEPGEYITTVRVSDDIDAPVIAKDGTITVPHGGIAVAVTDGAVETMSGPQTLGEAVTRHGGNLRAIAAEVVDRADAEGEVDDITIVVVQDPQVSADAPQTRAVDELGVEAQAHRGPAGNPDTGHTPDASPAADTPTRRPLNPQGDPLQQTETDVSTSRQNTTEVPSPPRSSSDLVTALDPVSLTSTQLIELLDSGQITSVQLTQLCLERIEALSALNAVIGINPRALEEASRADELRQTGNRYGPLLGVPILIKGNIDIEGMPTTAGSVALAHSYPAADATLVKQLREAGAVILGHGNLTEFAFYLSHEVPRGYSSYGGQTLNPYDPSLMPGGSSSGSAVGVAAGLVPLAIGTQTAGSILEPCNFNSVVGLKPTVGAVSRTGILPVATTRDTAGAISPDVTGAAVLLTALVGVDPQDPATAHNPLAGHDFTADLNPEALRGARIGVMTAGIPSEDAAQRLLWDAVLDTLAAQGATLIPVDLNTTDSFQDNDPPWSSVFSYEFKRDLNAYLSRLPADAPMKTLADIIAYNNAHAETALKYGQNRALSAEAIDLDPDSADTAKYKADLKLDLAESKDRIDAVMTEHKLTALVSIYNFGTVMGDKAGYPCIIVPAGRTPSDRDHPAGEHVNVTFRAAAWSEPTLISYAYAFEQARGVRRARPQFADQLYRAAAT